LHLGERERVLDPVERAIDLQAAARDERRDLEAADGRDEELLRGTDRRGGLAAQLVRIARHPHPRVRIEHDVHRSISHSPRIGPTMSPWYFTDPRSDRRFAAR